MDKDLALVTLYVVRHKLQDCCKILKNEIESLDNELKHSIDTDNLLSNRKDIYSKCVNSIEEILNELYNDAW